MESSKGSQRIDSSRLRQSGMARIAPVFMILFAIALGALAAPGSRQQGHDHDQYRDQDRDHDRDRFLFVSRESVARDFGGGHGGRPSPDAQCAPQSVAVGFHVQTGEYFNTAWLDCVPIRPDGRLGDETRMTERTGSPGGRPVHDAFCPQHFALRGLRGRSGASIDEVVGECTPLREIAERADRPRTEWTQSVTRPNPGGHPAEAECPIGFVVTGFRSMSGEYMDHLWVMCSELRARDRDHDR
jgi:hypothetical protein